MIAQEAGGDVMDQVDLQVSDFCENMNVFSYTWALQTPTPDAVLVLLLTTIIQCGVPIILLTTSVEAMDKMDIEFCPMKSDAKIKLFAFLLMLYLISTFSGAYDRLAGMATMVTVTSAGPAYTLPLRLGVPIVMASIWLTAFLTFTLFVSDPQMSSILLNCVAVNFIVDVDSSMVSMVKSVRPAKMALAQSRLDKIGETWPDSQERSAYEEHANLPLLKRMQKKGMMEIARLARGPAVLVLSLTLPTLGAVCL